MRIVHLIIIQTIIIFLAVSSYAAETKDMVFTISSDKSEYTKSDPININFKLKNNSKDASYVNRRFYINSEDAKPGEREVYFSVVSPEGKKLISARETDTGIPRTEYFILLEPGSETSADSPKNIKYLFDFTKPGTYQIMCTYKNIYGEELGLDTFRDKVDSKPIMIEIKE